MGPHCLVSEKNRPPADHYGGNNDKSQDPYEHQDDSDGYNGHHHRVVASVRAEQPPNPASDSTRRPAHVYHSLRRDALLQVERVHVSSVRRRRLLLLFRQGESSHVRGAGQRLVFHLELPFAAFEADGEDTLHLRRELLDDVLVVAEAR